MSQSWQGNWHFTRWQETWRSYNAHYPMEHNVFCYPKEGLKRDPPLSHECFNEVACHRQLQSDYAFGRYKNHILNYDKIKKACGDYWYDLECWLDLKSTIHDDYLDWIIKKNFRNILTAKSTYTWYAHSSSLLPLTDVPLTNDLMALYEVGLCCGLCHNTRFFTKPKMPDGTDIESNYFCGCFSDSSCFIPTSDQRKKWEKGEIGLFIPFFYNNVILPFLAIVKQNLTYLAFDYNFKTSSFIAVSASRVNRSNQYSSYCIEKAHKNWKLVDGEFRYIDKEIVSEMKLFYRRLIRRVFLEATEQYKLV